MKRCLVILSAFLLLTLASFAQQPLSKADAKLFKEFEKRVATYVKLRNKARSTVPVVKKDATPEEIERYKESFQLAVRTRRSGAKQGDIFVAGIQPLFKRIIKAEFPGFEATELRKQVLEADTKGVPLRINYPYPENKELVQMPPPLLLALPQLPKDLRYRFVGRSLVLMDRDAAIMIDLMRNALP
jgi:hypothetical protein